MSPVNTVLAKKTLIKLIVIQWGFVVICGLGGWIFIRPNVDPLRKLSGISVEEQVVIDEEIKSLIPNGALLKDDRRQAEFFLYMLAEGTNWDVTEVRPITRIPDKGAVPTDYRLVMTGDPFNLPVFLDGIYRQPAIAMIQSVELHMRASGSAKVVLRIRYFEPENIPIPDYVLEGLNDSESQVVEKGWELWKWRSWEELAVQLRQEDIQRRHDLQYTLAPPIIELRNQEHGQILWTKVGGLQVRN